MTYKEANCGRFVANKGFSLLELCLVVVVLAIMYLFAYQSTNDRVARAKMEAIRYQAKVFSRAVNNIRAQAILKGEKKIELNNKEIYLNEKGWPANTNSSTSPKSYNQTARECQQLWNGLYESPPTSILNIKNIERSTSYIISSINGRICRYELIIKKEENYFFDYHLNTGKIIVSYQK